MSQHQESSGKEMVFGKYETRGAYHWDMISRNPRKHHPFVAARYRICLDLLGSVTGMKVLDLGCGDGALSGLIAKAGGDVTGFDLNPIGLDLARRQFLRHRLTGEFHPSIDGLPSGYFDAVVCTEVIEHVANPRRIFKELYRVLKPEGIAVVSTPIRLTEEALDLEHVREYFPSEFQSLCAEDFEILLVKHALPVGLHEVLYIEGIRGKLISISLKTLSAWFNWNYIHELRGTFRLYEVQFAKLKRR